jgi:hypothetical protein
VIDLNSVNLCYEMPTGNKEYSWAVADSSAGTVVFVDAEANFHRIKKRRSNFVVCLDE